MVAETESESLEISGTESKKQLVPWEWHKTFETYNPFPSEIPFL